MKIGFIGAGNVAQTYAAYFAYHGHEVILSNSRGPESLKELVQTLGPKIKAGTPKEAANQELVILAVRWEQATKALAEIPDWSGRILVDATNRPFGIETQGKTASEVISAHAPGARLVKALNTLVVNWIAKPLEAKHKLVLFLSGDDLEAKQKLAGLLDESGFVPVDIGSLREGGRLADFGAPLSSLHLDLIKRMKF